MALRGDGHDGGHPDGDAFGRPEASVALRCDGFGPQKWIYTMTCLEASVAFAR